MSTTPKVEHKMSDEKPNNSENLFELYRDIIPDFDAFMDRIRKPLGNFIRVNTLRTSPQKLQNMLGSRGIKSRITRLGGYFLEILVTSSRVYCLSIILACFTRKR